MTIDLTLGDMLVTGEHHPPAKLAKAMAVVTAELRSAYAGCSRFRPDAMFDSCVLNSLVVRDFLIEIGFHGAKVIPVSTLIAAWEGDTMLHSLGIGAPHDKRKAAGRWPGHMVVVAAGWLIDTTLWRTVDRPAWRGNLPGMIAIEIEPLVGALIWGLRPLACAAVKRDDYEIGITWLDNPGNTSWQRGPDARDPVRRRPLVRALVERFGLWEEAEAS